MNFRVPIRACLYAIEHRLSQENFRLSEKLEKLVFKCPASSYLYAKYVLKSRIPNENIFKNKVCLKQNYRYYEPKKITSQKEINIDEFNFFNKIFSKFTIVNSNINYIVNFESDSPVIKNNYISVAYLYAKDIIKGRLPIEIEKVAFIDQPISCYLYIKDIIKDVAPEYLENIIKNNSSVLLSYSQKFKNNLKDLEVYLSPQHAIVYCKEIIKSNLSKEHEKIIFSNDVGYACEYAISVLSNKFENFHDFIILKSLEKNQNINIKNYLCFCNHLQNTKKFKTDLINFLKNNKTTQKLKIIEEENCIWLHDNILIEIEKSDGIKVPCASVGKVDRCVNSSTMNTSNLTKKFGIEENYNSTLKDVVAYAFYLYFHNELQMV